MEIGLVQKVDIDQEMQQAYLDYAMSVIVARALPDARDGLKPVHRRILYAMHDMGLRADSTYKKSARIVGEVLGKYHPHGDMAVYEAMARMAQDFSMRYTLVDGQGNFGSIDGDPPAAMRYTEARLGAAAGHMLTDIAKNTVDYGDNFDGTLTEPVVLPAAIPNLLVNGATGIAVGMATNIPPHNLGEVVDALQFMLQNWDRQDDISIDELVNFVKGPDFPTGGVIIQSSEGDGLIGAYSTGRGKVTVQASAHLEEMERGRNRIIVTELPYMTNKSALIERIADLAREARIEGIVDLRDESDRQGMRIVIELSKTANPDAVLRDLYKHTPMQSTFSIIMLALINGEPRHLSLKLALRVYLDHRLEIIRRRSEYDLEKARARAHILEGLLKAINDLDAVIALIRKSPDVETARVRLIKYLKISEVQAQAILDMQLRRLAALERKKIEEEHKELRQLIKSLEALLKSPQKMRQVVAEELHAIKELFGDRRRTHIVQLKEGESKTSLLTKTDLVEDKQIWVSIQPDGLVARTTSSKPPRQSGKDAPKWLLKASTRDTLYILAENGEAAALQVHALPEVDESGSEDRTGERPGVPFHKLTPFSSMAELAGAFALPPRGPREEANPLLEQSFILTATRQGMLKKTSLSELPGASASLFTLVKVNPGDRLGWSQITNGSNEIFLVTRQGMAIRFGEDAVRAMGLAAAGVMGIKLQAHDEVCGLSILPQDGDVLLVSTGGKGKRVPVSQFPRQGRYGQGVIAWKLSPGDGVAGMAIGKGAAHATLHFDKLLPRSIRFDEIPLQTRATRGAVLPEVKPGQQVVCLTVPSPADGPDQDGRTPVKRKGGPSQDGLPKAPRAPKSAAAAPPKADGKNASGKNAVQMALPGVASNDPARSAPKKAAKATPATAKPTKPAPKSAAKATPAAAKPTKPAPKSAAKATTATAKPTKATPQSAAKASPAAAKPTKATPQSAAKASPAAAKPTKAAPKSAAKASPAAAKPTKATPQSAAKASPAAAKPTKATPQSAAKAAPAPAAKTVPAPTKPKKPDADG